MRYGKGKRPAPIVRRLSERGVMEHTHAATGLTTQDYVRVEVLWTPGKEGTKVIVRDGTYGTVEGEYEAPSLAILPLSPDTQTLNNAVRLMLSRVRVESWHTDHAWRLATGGRFKWVPEKLGGKRA